MGPGLGDIARQMQMAQRNQALHAQQMLQKQHQAAAAAAQGQKLGSPLVGMGNGVQTPPMSRSGSEQGVKRRAEDSVGDAEGGVKRQC